MYPKRIECPECEGAGYIEIVIRQTYDGDLVTRRVRCEQCDGYGKIDEPVGELECA